MCSAVIVWELSSFVEAMRCELKETAEGFALGLRMGDELILTELLPDEQQARRRASELRTRMMQRGWLERQ
jgi:hypothetical protein